MTDLPLIDLEGPAIPRVPGKEDEKLDRVFWSLRAVVPAFGLDAVKPASNAVQEDRIHPMRTLMLDPDTTEIGKHTAQVARLLSSHIGAGGGDEKLSIDLGAKKTLAVSSKDFVTGGFQHVAIEPILDPARQWPEVGGSDIVVPRFRLVAGAILLIGEAKEFAWLGDSVAQLGGKTIRVILTPDGIEITAKLPFPGTTNPILGKVLLFPTAAGPRLRLLSERLDNPKEWLDAWRAVTPKDDEAGEIVIGLKLSARRDGLPPAFVWTPVVKSNVIREFAPAVEIPASDLDVRLLSPEGPNGVDGVVTLQPDSYSIAAFNRQNVPDPLKPPVAVKWPQGNAPALMLIAHQRQRSEQIAKTNPATQLIVNASPASAIVKLESTNAANPVGHRCAHDEIALAASLRAAYGIDELRPGFLDEKRPLLSAFVPLDDGWLQLPVPNVAPRDVRRDDEFLPTVGTIANVLSGYLRFAQGGTLPAVLSAYPETEVTIEEAPWVITVEGSQELALVVGIDRTGASGSLVGSITALVGPELSTRGLVWISADRPDIFEALPRIGAGAGAYFDIPIETFDLEQPPAVQFTLGELALTMRKKSVQRDKLAVGVAFDQNAKRWTALAVAGKVALSAARSAMDADPTLPVRWQRHTRMALASSMPMTRGAGSAVRPLESRDLVPFLFDADASRVLTLKWASASAVFPDIDDRGCLRPIATWPWPLSAKQDRPRGIAMTAFGVPGAETTFEAPSTLVGDAWSRLRFALRYDLPVLDEAFATATLPPQPPDKQTPEERDLPAQEPVPLAYDWVTMKRFWDEQERRHQLALVAHSHLSAFREGKVAAGQVDDLVGRLPWTTDFGFTPPLVDDTLPYGSASVGTMREQSGNGALLGVSGRFKRSGETLVATALDDADPQAFDVVGYAPGSFLENDFLMDSRRIGTKQVLAQPRVLWRPIKVADPEVQGLATLLAPIEIGNFFRFWFKDLPVKNGALVAPPKGIELDAWQDEHLPLAGLEWRLIPKLGDLAAIFERGRDRIPFFGFALEPLRLVSCSLAMNNGIPTGGVTELEIRARLHLGPMATGPQPDGNLIKLSFTSPGGAFALTSITGDVRFALDAAEAGGARRRVVLSGKSSWNGASFTLADAKLILSMFGADHELTGVKLKENLGKLSIDWDGAHSADLTSGEGKLVIDHVGVVTTMLPSGEAEVDVSLTTTRRILLTPRAKSRALAGAHPAAIRIKLQDNKIESANLAGLAVTQSSATFTENDGAFTLTMRADHVNGNILSSLQVVGTLSLGLMARVGESKDGAMTATAGVLDGELVSSDTPDPRVALRRIAFHADRQRRGESSKEWIGEIRFYGELRVDNAIEWPGITNGEQPEAIPVRGLSPNGRTRIEIDATIETAHSVRYILDGHAMSFDLAAGVLAEDPDAVWTLPVVSKHTLQRNGENAARSFTAVETIAIGSAVGIIPRLDDPLKLNPQHPLDKDRIAFAARHRELIDKGSASKKDAPGMIAGGAGRIATVLRGALGLPFRETFWRTSHSGLFLAGGFAGLVGVNDGDEAPLLRLPLLMAFASTEKLATKRILQQNGVASAEVAWADGRAASQVVATLRSAVTPASASDDALRTALLAGSRRIAGLRLGAADTVAAVLVEQSFAVNSDALRPGDLEKTPFFLAAAVSLARTWSRIPFATEPPATVLSLLAGHGLGEIVRTLATAVVTRSIDEPKAKARALEVTPELTTLGEDVVVRAWTGPAVGEAGESIPVALIAGPATIDHVQPRAAMLRTLESSGASRYDAPALPKRPDRARESTIGASRDFADARRGYALPFEVEESMRWLAGPEEGRMKPFRDADPPATTPITASGLAGLSRTMSMPAHASRRGLVWVAQTRAPIYLSLPFPDGGVTAPPIPWLAPGTPRPRIPTHALSKDMQPILPERATVASVGDRAGISIARIARFEASIGDVAAFDGRYARFGRPAQGGTWSTRTERTPRPGPLPENGKDEMRNRRPCATPLLPGEPLAALAGPADTISGEANRESQLGPWSVTFVAASEWNGMITESWDGTVRLLAEIDVAPDVNDVAGALETLYRVLFVPKASDPKDLRTRAELVIGKRVVPFLTMHVETVREFAPVKEVRRAVVTLVLDARSTPSSQPGVALPGIAEAFSAAVLPAVELRLIVHPETRPRVDAFTAPSSSTLSTEAAPLAEGTSRAPVTLRMPLAPVVRSRGALPLAPTSLLFTDPSYNAGLASAPVAHRAPIVPPAVLLPETRGALFAVLYGDRGRVNRKASITFMMDLAFERKLDDFARIQFAPNTVDGDIVIGATSEAFDIRVEVVAKTGERRPLFIATPAPKPVPEYTPPKQPQAKLATVYELSLSSLVEKDGTLAALVAGDMLELTLAEGTKRISTKLIGASTDLAQSIAIASLHAIAVTRTLRILLTDEPVVEPPPALYAALVRRRNDIGARLSLPLYAQSPLPWRVDLRDAKGDFRRGLMRRLATFIWTLARPHTERDRTGIHIVKVDRNGQTYLPPKTNLEEFVKARKPV